MADKSALAQLSPGALFLYEAVFKSQTNLETARRFFPVLRQWAETKKQYRGRVFSAAEVEEVIASFENHVFVTAGSSAKVEGGTEKGSSSADAADQSTPKLAKERPWDGWWPLWVLDKKVGIEVLCPSVKGKPPEWASAKPVGIGYRGQKKRYLFVRAAGFEMDCRRSEVRPPGMAKTAEDQLQDLLTRGDDPARHPEWTDGTGLGEEDANAKSDAYLLPGIETASSKSGTSASSKTTKTSEEGEILDELESSMERMALLHRSANIRISTCDHPDPLSEPRTAASIRLPPLGEDDVLRLPAAAASERLSSLQLETVCYAARRFRMSLPDGRTAGYVLGDGTGCGKGRVISALIFHMWNSGCRRSVWVSATNDLYHDACRDLSDLGASIPCVQLRKLPPSGPLDKKGSEANRELVRNMGIEGDGVIFLTYSLLIRTGERRKVFVAQVRSEHDRRLLSGEGGLLDGRLRCKKRVEKFGDPERIDSVELLPGDRVVGVQSLKVIQTKPLPFTLSFERVLHEKKTASKDQKDSGARGGLPASSEDIAELTAWNSRLGQIVAWLGGDAAGGLIAFDEVHKAKNLVPEKNDTASTKTGLYVDLLQRYCPKAPVLYVSATAATEMKHLGYMSRLGLWGKGTAFDDFHDFLKALEKGGVAGMEMLAMNAKALGALSCRALAYVGTEFVTQQCGLTEAQREKYDEACRFWQKLLKYYRKFIESKDLEEIYRAHFFKKAQKLGGDMIKRFWQFYWGYQQRFFKAMCNASKVPAAVDETRKALDRGEQVVISIWATGEARTRDKMAALKDETPGKVIIKKLTDGGLVVVEIKDRRTREQVATFLTASMRMKADVSFSAGTIKVPKHSQLIQVHGRRITKPEDLLGAELPAQLVFRSPNTRRISIDAELVATREPVKFELKDDSLGERVIVGKVAQGPDSFKQAEVEGWHVKTLGNRPVGKLQVRTISSRLKAGLSIAFQDAIIPEHLSGPEMIVEHFVKRFMLTKDSKGREVKWAAEMKEELLAEIRNIRFPANAMDDILDQLGGVKHVAEMSGRSHRIKRKRDGALAYVARAEELRCTLDGANLVEQVLFQKGTKKVCMVTEVASAGISLHADRRQLRKDYTPPRRCMVSLELPWGADKAIQVFGRVHRANQLVPPRFVTLCTPLGGEVRFISAIARRMKLLGAVTKGDRMASMGGVADRHMGDFDINNMYGIRALAVLYTDTIHKREEPELKALYEAQPFIGEASEQATGRWPNWESFAKELCNLWHQLNMKEDMDELEIKANNLEKKGSGGQVVDDSGELNRFLNRLLMLEFDVQNAIFDMFFAIYQELVRIDKANGTFDDGIENLNQFHGRVIREVEVASREVLFTDPATGAETQYVKLQLDRGISWECVKDAYDALPCDHKSIAGFWAFRKEPESTPYYFFLKEKLQIGGAGGDTWLAQRRRKEYTVWRADLGVAGSGDGGLKRNVYYDFDFNSDDRYQRLEGSRGELMEIETGWRQLYESSATTRLAEEHMLCGDVLSAWRLVAAPTNFQDDPNEENVAKAAESKSLKIVRATSKGGDPIVGIRISEEAVPHLRYVLGCQHASMREQSEGGKDPEKDCKDPESVQDIVTVVAERLLRRLREADGQKLPYASWFEVHKVLSAEDDENGPAIPRSTFGLRGVQRAVELLLKRKRIMIDAGNMSLLSNDKKTPEGLDLEMELFPEEFVHAPGEEEDEVDDGSEDSDASFDRRLANDDFDDLDHFFEGAEEESTMDPALDASLTEDLAKDNDAKKSGKKGKHKKSNADEFDELPTPARSKPAKRSGGRAATTIASDRKKKKQRCSEAPNHGADNLEDDADANAMFDNFFSNEAASPGLGEERAGSAATPEGEQEAGTEKRRRLEMQKALFGDSGEESDGSA